MAISLERLKSQLMNTGLQQKDNPLFQVISHLIDAVRQGETTIIQQIGGGGSSSSPLSDKTYITVSLESATLPNSRQLLAGVSVDFDDTIANKRTINVIGEREIDDFTTASLAAGATGSGSFIVGANDWETLQLIGLSTNKGGFLVLYASAAARDADSRSLPSIIDPDAGEGIFMDAAFEIGGSSIDVTPPVLLYNDDGVPKQLYYRWYNAELSAGTATITLTFVVSNGGGSGGAGVGNHNIRSSVHSDSVAGAGVTGDLLTYDGGWTSLPVGVNGRAVIAVAGKPAYSVDGTGLNINATNLISGDLPLARIPNDLITLAKLVNASGASKLLGRGSAAGAGDFEEITLGSGLTLTGTVLSSSGSGGDVVGPAVAVNNGFALFDGTTGKLIKDNGATVSLTTQVSGDLPFANITQIATASILGRNTAGTGDIEILATLPNAVQDNITRLGTVVSGSIPESIIADGTILTRRTANETVTGNWTFNPSAGIGLVVSRGITAGTGVVDIIDSTGKIPAISSTYFASLSGANLISIPETAITDGTILARLAADETISGAWTFNKQGTSINHQTSFDGALTIQVFNTNGGAAAIGRIQMFNDIGALGYFGVFSSGYSPTGAFDVANGAAFRWNGAGGLALVSQHVSGDIRFYSGGTTERIRLSPAGGFSIGDTTDPGTGGFRFTGQMGKFGGELTPAALSAGDNNNYNPTNFSTSTIIRLTPHASGSAITGIAGGVTGRIVVFIKLNANTLSFDAEDAASTAANRIATGILTTAINGAYAFYYDGVLSRWRLLWHNQ